jgi:ABC-type spermidine/putrescine transport system permease subunit II
LLERGAASLGAGPITTFRLVTFPILKAAFASAALLAALASLDDLVVALFLGGPGVTTLQIQMWRGIRFESDPSVAAVSCLMMLLSLAAFCVVRYRDLKGDAV